MSNEIELWTIPVSKDDFCKVLLDLENVCYLMHLLINSTSEILVVAPT